MTARNPLVLIHGGWGGADAHWSRVVPHLETSFDVFAPDLPGLGDVAVPALPAIADYARWMVEQLDARGFDRAALVGNSFGAAVACSVAGRFPDRCAGLALVNGVPMPATPWHLRLAGNNPIGRAVMRSLLRRLAYNPGALEKAFHEIESAPAQFAENLNAHGGPLLPRFTNLIIAGDGPPDPEVPYHLIWGANDDLPGTQKKDGEALRARIDAASFDVIEEAGHFPQIEQPEEFAKVVTALFGSELA